MDAETDVGPRLVTSPKARNLAKKYRPRRFSEVVGQDDQVRTAIKIVEKGWRPSALLITGPFGTGKTTLARLLARAILCDATPEEKSKVRPPLLPHEPCLTCQSCRAVEEENNPNYVEVDAATHNSVEHVRALRDLLTYRSGRKPILVTVDESHMLSPAAQNNLLQSLEEGITAATFIFATTEPQKMLPTIRSRCIIMETKLLKASAIAARITEVAEQEGIQIEPRAASIIGSYVRGHVRDGLMYLEQLSQTAGEVGEDVTRAYLRLDRNDEIYRLLTTTVPKEFAEQLELLLCVHAPSDLVQAIGQVLLDAYKLGLGIDPLAQVDRAWLERVREARGDRILTEAEETLKLDTDFASINYAIAALCRVLNTSATPAIPGAARGLAPAGAATIPPSFRKPGK